VALADPFALPPGPRDEDGGPTTDATPSLRLEAWDRARKAKGVGAAPATCAAFASRAAAKVAPESLALALAEADVARRDALLVAFAKTHAET
jgi:hypothetical protein